MQRYIPALLLTILLVNASAILGFNYFITVDGPLHVFHASLLETPWSSTGQIAHGITYDPGTLRPWLGHYILKILLLFVSPVQAHDLFAALVSCAVVLSLLALARAHGIRVGVAFLWLAPLAINVLLIMGLFHFLLGVAIALGTLAWWVTKRAAPHWRYVGLVFGAALAWSAHRSAPLMLCMFVLPTLLISFKQERTETRLPNRSRVWQIPLAGLFLAFILLALGRAAPGFSTRIYGGLPQLDIALLTRSLVLPGIDTVQWPVIGIGILLLVSIAAGAGARWVAGRGIRWHDTYLVFFLGLMVTSWFFDTPGGRRLLIAERCQWLALICLVVWLIAMANVARGWPRHAIIGAAVCALPLHVVRLVHAGDHFSQARIFHDHVLEAEDALLPGSLVLPVRVGPQGVMQRMKAYVAMNHDGIIMTPDEPLRLRAPSTPHGIQQLSAILFVNHWPSKWREGIPGEVDHVLFLGQDIERRVRDHPWNVLLASRYRLTYSNEHAWVYTIVPE